MLLVYPGACSAVHHASLSSSFHLQPCLLCLLNREGGASERRPSLARMHFFLLQHKGKATRGVFRGAHCYQIHRLAA